MITEFVVMVKEVVGWEYPWTRFPTRAEAEECAFLCEKCGWEKVWVEEVSVKPEPAPHVMTWREMNYDRWGNWIGEVNGDL